MKILLNKVIKQVHQTGTIFYKPTQICVYANDGEIIGTNEEMIIELFKEGKIYV